jgi:hypothetical protein
MIAQKVKEEHYQKETNHEERLLKFIPKDLLKQNDNEKN